MAPMAHQLTNQHQQNLKNNKILHVHLVIEINLFLILSIMLVVLLQYSKISEIIKYYNWKLHNQKLISIIKTLSTKIPMKFQ
jgi:hypothetical protein